MSADELEEQLLDVNVSAYQSYQAFYTFSPLSQLESMSFSPRKRGGIRARQESSTKSLRSVQSAHSIVAENPVIIEHKGKPIIIPDGGFGWLVVFCGFFVQFFILGLSSCFGVFLPIYVNEFKSDPGQVAWVGSISVGMIDLLAAMSGKLADRFGNRIIVIGGTVLIFIGLIIASLATSLWQLYLTQGLIAGVGFSMAFISGVSVVGQWFTTKRGLATGVTLAGAGVGQLVLALVANYLIITVGWRYALRYLAIIMLGGLMVCSIGIVRLFPLDTADGDELPLNQFFSQLKWKHTPFNSQDSIVVNVDQELESTTRNDVEDGDLQPALQPSTQYGNELTIIQNTNQASLSYLLLNNKNFFMLYCTIFTVSLGLSMPSSHLMNYALLHHIDAQKATLLISTVGIGSAIGRFGIGYIADQFDKIVIMRYCLIIVGGVTLIWTVLTSFPLLLTFAIVYGIFSGGFYSLIPSVATEIFGVEKLGALLGALYTACCIGDFIAAPVGGFIFAATDSYIPAIIFAASVMLGGVFFTFGVTISKDTKADKVLSLSLDEELQLSAKAIGKHIPSASLGIPSSSLVSKSMDRSKHSEGILSPTWNNNSSKAHKFHFQKINEDGVDNIAKATLASSSSHVDRKKSIRSRSRSMDLQPTLESYEQSSLDPFSEKNKQGIVLPPPSSSSGENDSILNLTSLGELLHLRSQSYSSRGMWNPPSMGLMSPWRMDNLPSADANSFKYGSYEDGGAFKYGISMR